MVFYSPHQTPEYPQITTNPPSILCLFSCSLQSLLSLAHPLSYQKNGIIMPKCKASMLTLPNIPITPYIYLPEPLCLLISPSSGRIWLDNLSCSGTERSVTECASRGWGNSDCTHDEDAGVICKDQRLPGFSDSNVIEVCSSHTHTHTPPWMARQRGLWGVICD